MSTRYTRRSQTVDELERLSTLLASALLRGAEATTSKADVVLARRGISLRLREPPELREAEEAPRGVAYALRSAWRRLRALPKRLDLELVAVKVGVPSLIFFPGELFNEYQLELKRVLGGPCTLVGYSCSYLGYVPSEEYVVLEVYEVAASLVDPSEYASLRGALLELARELR